MGNCAARFGAVAIEDRVRTTATPCSYLSDDLGLEEDGLRSGNTIGSCLAAGVYSGIRDRWHDNFGNLA